MLDPTDLYRLESDGRPVDARQSRASVLLVCTGALIDAGNTQRLLVEHILTTLQHTVVASFDIDQLLDYRGRRPPMVFDRDRWSEYDDPALLLHRVVDASGTPFLVLAGPEPDYQWERMVAAVQSLIEALGVSLTVHAHGIPMAVPHTRPIGVTGHATSPRLLGERSSVFGRVQVPGSFTSLLELRLGEAGHDAIGYAVHVPHYLAQAEYADAAVVALRSVVGVTGLEIPAADLTAAAGLNRAEIAKEVAGSDEVARVVEALERQYDAFVEGRGGDSGGRPSLLATDVSELPTAEEIGAEFERYLRNQADG